MKNIFLGIVVIVAMSFISCNMAKAKYAKTGAQTNASIYDFTMKDIDGKDVSLANYKGKVVIIVNTASKCGLTPQYKSIEAMYQKYKDKGVVVLGFPANNFLSQEPGTDSEIKGFCQKNYGVSFPMFSKISVKGDDIHPLYQYLTMQEKNGSLDAPVKWNFQKFIINKEGKVVCAIGPRTTVDDVEFTQALEDILK